MDIFDKSKRSLIMAAIRSTDTKPEIYVRSLIHRMGFRFRKNRKDLPGTPDIVLPKHRKIIFIHGCFWHDHKGCRRSSRPATNKSFWVKKLETNVARDKRILRKLRSLGWRVLVIWECQLKNEKKLKAMLEKFLIPEGGR